MDAQLLGRGIYDVVEVARLVERSVDEVAGWATGTRERDALLIPRHARLLSFYDLVTAFVVAEFRRRGVPLPKIRDARRHLAQEFDVPWPLAHADALASVGSDVYFVADGAWFDAGRGGQGAIQQVVRPLLHRLEFDAERMANLWRPTTGIVVNPHVQAGAPCVEGTRLTTQFVADLANLGESPDDIARDYGVSLRSVRQALAFEHSLAA